MAKGDSWTTESGLLDDYDFKVEEVWFGPNEDNERDPDKIYLNLRGEARIDGDVEDDEHVERYSTGKNWEVVEDGEEVENATGKQKFNQNAGIGHFIRALVALGDDEAEFLQKKGEAYEAATFNELQMHMERKIASVFTSDDTGEEVEWTLALPTSLKVKSKKGGKGKAGRGKGSKGGSKKTASSLRSDVSEFAAEFDKDEHDEFVDQVLDEDVYPKAENVMADDELHAEILDPDSDLWADAHK